MLTLQQIAERETMAVEYRDIPGFPGYRASDDGFIWTCWKRIGIGRGAAMSSRWKKLKPENNRGYRRVRLAKDGAIVRKSVHTLILETFVGECPAGMECAHLNGNPSDNRKENLAWKTHQANMDDRILHGTTLYADKCPARKLCSSDVVSIRALHASGVSSKEIAIMYGIDRTNVWQIVTRKSWRKVV